MLKNVLNILSYRRAEDFLFTLAGKIERTDPKDSPLYFTPNLLLLILNIYEICILITKEYPFLNAHTEGILDHLTSVGSNFVSGISDEEKLRSIVFEKDFEYRDSLELLSTYDITSIMDNNNMEKIALELWSSEYDVKGNIMECSSAATIISWNTFNKPRDLVDEYMFYSMKYRKKNSHHLFQYQVWKKSMMAKFLTEALFLVILTVVFQYFLVAALNSGYELLTVYEAAVAANSTQEAIDTALEEHHAAAVTFFKDMEITEYLSMIAFFYPVRILLETLYATMVKKPLNFFTFTNILDFTFSICFIIRLGREYDRYQDGLSSISDEGKKAVRYFENIYEFANDEILLDILYAVAMTALWIRILFMFRLTRFLGPLIKMVFNMLWDIMIFMVLFGILLVIYASMAVLLFYTETGYTDFWEALVTLFGSALGNFDLAGLDGSNKGKLVGELYLISFIILCNVLILNLLIAILSSTYAKLEEKKLVLYINEILKLRSSLEYDARASGLISAFPPWNVFPLLFSPLFFFMKNTRKLNEFICYISYIPIMCVVSILFIVLNIVILPLAYFKGVLVKFQFLFNKKVEIPVLQRILTMIIFVIFGPIILILNLCVDIYVFFLHLFQRNINYRKEKSKVQFISSQTYNQLQIKFDRDTKNGVEAIDFVETAEYCRSLMGVMNMLRDIIFAKTDNGMTFDRQIFLLQEYGKVKSILYSGAIKHGSQRYIFPTIWKFVMRELKINSRIRKILKHTQNEFTKDISVIKVLEKDIIDDSGKDYLRQFLQISFGDVHEAIKATKNEEMSMDSIKEMFKLVLFEQSKEGQEISKKMNKKTPFRKNTTMMSRSGSKWNLPEK
mmetsp:Transcript_8018/g.7094  ORF Transcript_8018/g.7094 Transcript_8018/m.7094 type:complete len:848 (+) Transcript_8018:309-2852(+)